MRSARHTVHDEDLIGVPDSELLAVCRDEQRMLRRLRGVSQRWRAVVARSMIRLFPRYREGLIRVGETYTAVYERAGDLWTAEIAEEPGVRSAGASVADIRERLRRALAERLGTDPAALRIADEFRMPAQVRAARQAVQHTRTEQDRAQMMASMTDPRPAAEWAEELGISLRDPVTVEWLKTMGDKEVSIDTFCHTITMMEELSRFAEKDCPAAPQGVLDER